MSFDEEDKLEEERRTAILRGIGMDLTDAQIAAEIGIKRWEVRREMKLMRSNMDRRLLEAERSRMEIRTENESKHDDDSVHKVLDERFKRMEGMDLQTRSFLNMISYYEVDLRRILVSKDEKTAAMSLPRSVRRVLINNEILDHGILTKAAREVLNRA